MNALISNEKYNALLKTSHELFWKFGFRRVSIEEICREARVSKMTFYRFFPNKPELVKTIIKNMFDTMLSDYRNLMNQNIPFEDKIRQQLLLKFEGTKNMSQELMRDIYGDPESEMHKQWVSLSNEMMHIVLNDYRHAQDQGWIRKDIRIEYIMYMSNKTVEIASDPKLQALYPDMQSLIMEIANNFFYGILPRDNKQ
jgi:AcrR family transcriptional regulator